MAFKNPWGKGEAQHDRWFNNGWSQSISQGTWNSPSISNSSEIVEANALYVAQTKGPEPDWLIYLVKDGERFDTISKKFGTSADYFETPAETLANRNGMNYSDPNQPKPGDSLALPGITNEHLDLVEQKLNNFTIYAYAAGWYVAISNLARFRKGTGGIKILDSLWLKSFSLVTHAMERIQEYFEEKCFSHYADTMADGEIIQGDGTGEPPGNLFWWNTVTQPNYIIPDEIDYACGSSTLTGIGKIKLTKSGDFLTVDGEVEFEFNDGYNWNPGDSVPMPTSNPNMPITLNYDSDMLLLEEYRGAKSFEMTSKWKQKVSGTVEKDTWSPNEIDIVWTDI